MTDTSLSETSMPAPQDEPVMTEPESIPTPIKQHKRDRVVILGRTQAGKTVFLAALYDACWNRGGSIRIEAVDGLTHKAMMENIEMLRAGKWPSSTTGTKYLDFLITVDGRSRPLVSLDYPGEVFRKVFIDGLQTDDVQDLIDHIDRAAAVIILVDPMIVKNAVPTIAMDDNYGMAKAIERIRSWPGGENIPVAIVLTKYDKYRTQIHDFGGAVKFVHHHYKYLVRSTHRANVFACSVLGIKQGNHENSTSPKVFDSSGTIQPIHWILNQLQQVELEQEAAEKSEKLQMMISDMDRKDRESNERNTKLWIIGWIAFIVIFFLIGFITIISISSK